MLFLKFVNGHNLVKKSDIDMSLCHIVALMEVTKCVKFQEGSVTNMEVVDKIKVCG